jgi:hypothetical protein
LLEKLGFAALCQGWGGAGFSSKNTAGKSGKYIAKNGKMLYNAR